MTEVVLGAYRLDIAEDYGPRITGLRRAGGEQIFAELGPDAVLNHPGGIYRFHGGHRLWVAPERADVSYANDDHSCQVEIGSDSVSVSADPDDAGVSKEIVVTVDEEHLNVVQTVSRQTGASWPMAAWAITQLPTEGVALLPLEGADTGPLPNRQIVLWPYTGPSDQRIRFVESGLTIDARSERPLKVGTGPHRSRLGYLRDGQLFIKELVSSTRGEVPDLGACNQVYVGQGFCELETVGGESNGAVASVTERWCVQDCNDLDMAWNLLAPGARS